MNRLARIGLVLLVLAAIGLGFIVLFDPLSNEAVIKKRFEKLIGHLCRNEIDQCVQMTSSERSDSSDTFRSLFSKLRDCAQPSGSELTQADFVFSSIKVEKDRETASVYFRFRRFDDTWPRPGDSFLTMQRKSGQWWVTGGFYSVSPPSINWGR